MGRYSSRHRRVAGIDRDGVGRPVDFGAFKHHLRQVDGGGDGRGNGAADEAAGIADREGQIFRGGVFGGGY